MNGNGGPTDGQGNLIGPYREDPHEVFVEIDVGEKDEGAIFQIFKAWRELVSTHESVDGMTPEEVEELKKKVVETYRDLNHEIVVGDEVVGTIVFQPSWRPRNSSPQDGR